MTQISSSDLVSVDISKLNRNREFQHVKSVMNDNFGKIHYSVDWRNREVVNAIAIPKNGKSESNTGTSKLFRSVINPEKISPAYNNLHLIPRQFTSVSGDFLNIYASKQLNKDMCKLEEILSRENKTRSLLYLVSAYVSKTKKLHIIQKLWDLDTGAIIDRVELIDKNHKYSFSPDVTSFSRQLAVHHLTKVLSKRNGKKFDNPFYKKELKDDEYRAFLLENKLDLSLFNHAKNNAVKSNRFVPKLFGSYNQKLLNLTQSTKSNTNEVFIPEIIDIEPVFNVDINQIMDTKGKFEKLPQFETLDLVIKQLKRIDLSKEDKKYLKQSIGKIMDLLI